MRIAWGPMNAIELTSNDLVRAGERLHGLDGLAGAVFAVDNDEVDRALVLRHLPLVKGALAYADDRLLADFATDLADAATDDRWDPVLSDVASWLPALDGEQYVDEAFLVRLQSAAMVVSSRLSTGWVSPTCVAEEVVVVLLVSYMRAVFDRARLSFFVDAQAVLESVLLGGPHVFGLYRPDTHFASEAYLPGNWFTSFTVQTTPG